MATKKQLLKYLGTWEGPKMCENIANKTKMKINWLIKDTQWKVYF